MYKDIERSEAVDAGCRLFNLAENCFFARSEVRLMIELGLCVCPQSINN